MLPYVIWLVQAHVSPGMITQSYTNVESHQVCYSLHYGVNAQKQIVTQESLVQAKNMMVYFNRTCHPAAIAGTTVLAPYHVIAIKSLI